MNEFFSRKYNIDLEHCVSSEPQNNCISEQEKWWQVYCQLIHDKDTARFISSVASTLENFDTPKRSKAIQFIRDVLIVQDKSMCFQIYKNHSIHGNCLQAALAFVYANPEHSFSKVLTDIQNAYENSLQCKLNKTKCDQKEYNPRGKKKKKKDILPNSTEPGKKSKPPNTTIRRIEKWLRSA